MKNDERPKEVGIYKKNNYKNQNIHKNSWIDPKKHVPLPFDLVIVKTNQHSKDQYAWWTGQSWEGINIEENTKILAWKRRASQYD